MSDTAFVSDTFAICHNRSTERWNGHSVGRAQRNFELGEIYHLTAHGTDDRKIFLDDVDRQGFVMRLRRVARTYAWELHAYCLMDTHYHVLTRAGQIAEGMRVLNGAHSRAFNERHGRRGALFESRYADRVIRDETHLAYAIAYIEENRLRAALDADWIWRSGNGV